MKTLAAMTSPPTSRRSPAAPAAPDQLVGVHERGVCMRAKTDISRGSVGGDVPVGEVAAGGLRVGDVIRPGDQQARRVDSVVVVDGSVVLEIRPIGFDVPDAVHLTLLAGVVVDRVGTTGD
jgi:hypothetical protein